MSPEESLDIMQWEEEVQEYLTDPFTVEPEPSGSVAEFVFCVVVWLVAATAILTLLVSAGMVIWSGLQ